jgi:hypothetical protein
MSRDTGETGIAMKLRDKINLLIDLLLFVALVGISGIGFLIKYTLPPGREKILKYGDNREFFFLGWDRHQWGSFHLFVAFIMLGLLALHILLHWKMILCLLRKAVPPVWLRRSLWGMLGVLCFFLFLFAFFISPEQREASDFLHRHVHSASVKTMINQNLCAPEAEKKLSSEAPKTYRGQEHRHKDEDHSSFNGRMMLTDAAKQFGISLDEVKKRLGLAADVDRLKTLGRLRKTYGFTMQEARNCLEKAE